ncbi:hypothetical protein PGT21_005791 [Puccinia graminis f. sp. tritici]|uniref:Uncharacterized protein n=1 Tax=Puccinia graminis f. sp. tritici TaxID=56615 RepID=A0A5B0MX41_PUCGR|nr:hypothetical protein PGT21_005791 [Puccinia graminis f. sp. tritici]KAA1120439.1 hypothetical protein PGTUg99_018382 [Puccinia graminis f. sp. tritici]
MKCSATAWLWAALIGGALFHQVDAVLECPKCGSTETRAIISRPATTCSRKIICSHGTIIVQKCGYKEAALDLYLCNRGHEWESTDCPQEHTLKTCAYRDPRHPPAPEA